jgi:predicted aldo/keto reductase-like oxidoreductase
MKAMRDFVRYGVHKDNLREWLLSQYPHSDIRAELAKCTACRQCEGLCPQHLGIVESIEKARSALGIN